MSNLSTLPLIPLVEHSLIIDQTHNIGAQLVRRIVAASLRFLEPNVARGDRENWVAVSACEGDVAVMAGSVDVEVVWTDDGVTCEGGASCPDVIWYYRLVQSISKL